MLNSLRSKLQFNKKTISTKLYLDINARGWLMLDPLAARPTRSIGNNGGKKRNPRMCKQ